MTTVINIVELPNGKIPDDGKHKYIGRGSKWGNDYTHLPLNRTRAKYQVATREEAIACHRRDIFQNLELLECIQCGELDDQILVCHCYPDSCHGDTLAFLANNPEVTQILINRLRYGSDTIPSTKYCG